MIQLSRIGKNSKRVYDGTGAYITGAVPLMPATPCCEGSNRRCATQPLAWAAEPVWKNLDFQIDEPALFQYSYESDGRILIAKAVGDLDCDGVPITFVLTGMSVNGNPTVTLTEPPPSSY